MEAGKVKAIGVSNYSAQQMRLAHATLAARGLPLASNQIQYSLLHRRPETNGVLDACRELGVTLIAYQPLASGALTGKYDHQNPPKGWRRMMPYFRKRGLAVPEPVIAALQRIGKGHGKSAAQVALRWLMEQPGVLPIPGARDGTQAASNALSMTFRLSAAEVKELADLTEASKR